MKTTVEIDIDDVISGLSAAEEKELAIQLATNNLDVPELLEIIRSLGFDDEDIVNTLDWETVKRYVYGND